MLITAWVHGSVVGTDRLVAVPTVDVVLEVFINNDIQTNRGFIETQNLDVAVVICPATF